MLTAVDCVGTDAVVTNDARTARRPGDTGHAVVTVASRHRASLDTAPAATTGNAAAAAAAQIQVVQVVHRRRLVAQRQDTRRITLSTQRVACADVANVARQQAVAGLRLILGCQVVLARALAQLAGIFFADSAQHILIAARKLVKLAVEGHAVVLHEHIVWVGGLVVAVEVAIGVLGRLQLLRQGRLWGLRRRLAVGVVVGRLLGDLVVHGGIGGGAGHNAPRNRDDARRTRAGRGDDAAVATAPREFTRQQTVGTGAASAVGRQVVRSSDGSHRSRANSGRGPCTDLVVATTSVSGASATVTGSIATIVAVGTISSTRPERIVIVARRRWARRWRSTSRDGCQGPRGARTHGHLRVEQAMLKVVGGTPQSLKAATGTAEVGRALAVGVVAAAVAAFLPAEENNESDNGNQTGDTAYCGTNNDTSAVAAVDTRVGLITGVSRQ